MAAFELQEHQPLWPVYLALVRFDSPSTIFFIPLGGMFFFFVIDFSALLLVFILSAHPFW